MHGISIITNVLELSVGVPPQILEPLSDTVVKAPKDAILECDIDVGEPEAEIKWYVYKKSSFERQHVISNNVAF